MSSGSCYAEFVVDWSAYRGRVRAGGEQGLSAMRSERRPGRKGYIFKHCEDDLALQRDGPNK